MTKYRKHFFAVSLTPPSFLQRRIQYCLPVLLNYIHKRLTWKNVSKISWHCPFTIFLILFKLLLSYSNSTFVKITNPQIIIKQGFKQTLRKNLEKKNICGEFFTPLKTSRVSNWVISFAFLSCTRYSILYTLLLQCSC